MVKEVIFKLEQAQDHYTLSMEELQLRRELKYKCLGVASLARIIARQCSRLIFLKEGDANTHFSTSKHATMDAKIELIS
jgi:hypothetical protein